MSFFREALEILLSLVISFTLIPVALPAGFNDNVQCVANGRVSGICQDIKTCSSSLGYLRASVTLPPCRVSHPEVNATYICCPQQKRISAIKCGESQNVLRKTVTPLLPLHFLEMDDKPSEIHCDPDRNALISGGRNAKHDEMPFMVALGYEVQNVPWRCGGTLISDKFILTAAHCVVNQYAGPPTKLLLGDITLNQVTSNTREIIDVAKVIVYPLYKPPLTYHDIALVKMSKKVNISKSIRPACLPQAEDDLLKGIDSKSFTAAGFGITGVGGIMKHHDFNNSSKPQSNTLQVVNLKGYNWKACNSFYKEIPTANIKFPNGISRTQICAGDNVGRNDTCQGDSGGPLLLPNKEKRCVFYVTGITSFGPNQCGERAPAIYTNVLSYLDWIENEVWNSKNY